MLLFGVRIRVSVHSGGSEGDEDNEDSISLDEIQHNIIAASFVKFGDEGMAGGNGEGRLTCLRSCDDRRRRI